MPYGLTPKYFTLRLFKNDEKIATFSILAIFAEEIRQ